MTSLYNLIQNSDDKIIGSIRLRPDNTVLVRGKAAGVWRSFRRHYDSDKPAFQAIGEAGWSNGHFSLVPRDQES